MSVKQAMAVVGVSRTGATVDETCNISPPETDADCRGMFDMFVCKCSAYCTKNFTTCKKHAINEGFEKDLLIEKIIQYNQLGKAVFMELSVSHSDLDFHLSMARKNLEPSTMAKTEFEARVQFADPSQATAGIFLEGGDAISEDSAELNSLDKRARLATAKFTTYEPIEVTSGNCVKRDPSVQVVLFPVRGANLGALTSGEILEIEIKPKTRRKWSEGERYTSTVIGTEGVPSDGIYMLEKDGMKDAEGVKMLVDPAVDPVSRVVLSGVQASSVSIKIRAGMGLATKIDFGDNGNSDQAGEFSPTTVYTRPDLTRWRDNAAVTVALQLCVDTSQVGVTNNAILMLIVKVVEIIGTVTLGALQIIALSDFTQGTLTGSEISKSICILSKSIAQLSFQDTSLSRVPSPQNCPGQPSDDEPTIVQGSAALA